MLAHSPAGDNAPPLSVGELSQALKRTVEDRFGHVRVRGELSGWKRAASGHCYFGLKDADALIDGVMWRGAAATLAFAGEDGLDVVATGRLTTYSGRSRYQVVVERLELAGEGALMALFERTRARLAAEGLFDPAGRRPIPYLPGTIGVVTSPTGSVIRDILHRLADRMPSHVVVWPVAVQGEGAAAQIAAALEGFNAGGPFARPDVLIVARGGGSVEDLWAFNEEVVVRAVRESRIPVICAVGHETDTSLGDLAADRRAPTPTAAAEMAVPVRAELTAGLVQAGARLAAGAERIRARSAERLGLVARLLPPPARLTDGHRQRLDDAAERLRRGGTDRLAAAHTVLDRTGAGLRPRVLAGGLARARERLATARLDPTVLARRHREARERLATTWRLAGALHPDAPLARGYVRVEGAGGRVLTTATDTRAVSRLQLVFADGRVAARVEGASRPAKPRAGAPEDQATLL